MTLTIAEKFGEESKLAVWQYIVCFLTGAKLKSAKISNA